MRAIWTDTIFDGRAFVDGPVEITLVGESIAAITRREADGAAGPDVLDARGAIVAPGLVNAHVHIARGGVFEPNERISATQTRKNLEGSLVAGVTTVGDMACAPGVIAALRAHTARSPAAGPQIRAAGPILTAPRGYPFDWLPPLFAKLGLALPCATEREGALAVTRVANAGMDHVKLAIMHQSYANTPLPAVKEPVARAIVAEARRLGLRVLAHAHSVADYEVALAAGVDALMHSSFEALGADTVARVRDAGIPVCPTLWVFESVCLGAEMRWDKEARFTAHVAPHIRRSWTRFAEAYAESGDVVPPGIAGGLPKSAVNEAVRIAAANLRLLRDAGVPIAFGNDASYGFSLVARPVDELAAMQRAGMSATDCLRAATRESAELLGCKDRGIVAAGKRADLMVVDARAREDVAFVEAPIAVVAAGERVRPRTVAERVSLGLSFWRGVVQTVARRV